MTLDEATTVVAVDAEIIQAKDAANENCQKWGWGVRGAFAKHHLVQITSYPPQLSATNNNPWVLSEEKQIKWERDMPWWEGVVHQWQIQQPCWCCIKTHRVVHSILFMAKFSRKQSRSWYYWDEGVDVEYKSRNYSIIRLDPDQDNCTWLRVNYCSMCQYFTSMCAKDRIAGL